MKVTEELKDGTVITCNTIKARVSAVNKKKNVAWLINFQYGVDALDYFNIKAYNLYGGCSK